MNKCIKCGCEDAYPSLPPNPTPPECPNQEPCAEVFNAQCLVLTIEDITCGEDIVVAQNDSIADALTNIVNYFCERLDTLTNYINSQLFVINGRLTTIEGNIVTINGQIINILADIAAIDSALTNTVLSVTGLDTDNTDPQNPIVRISVDGTTITGLGTPASPLVATGGGGGISGSGINNYVARWTPDGTTLGTGLIRDNGISVGIGNSPISNYRCYIETSTQLYGLYAKTSLAGTGNQIGVAGFSDGLSTGGINVGIVGLASGNSNINIGGSFSALLATAGTNIGIQTQVQSGATNYAAQLRDGTEGVGKVLTCITADGKANWADITNTNLQKVITTTYALTDADNDYTIFINNGATPITISLGAITIPNFSVGFIQEGTGDVTFSGAGLGNPIGFKLKGQGYQAFIERKLSTATYYLLGNTKA